MIDEIRQSVNKVLVLGNGRFKDEIEQLTGQRARPANMGAAGTGVIIFVP